MSREHKTYFNIHYIQPSSYIYGPGNRYVIWLQGCTLKCPNCWNPQMHSSEPYILHEREKLLSSILNTSSKISGVTILGGEPLEQPDNLLWLLEELNQRNVHIMLYTGYEIQEIQNNEIYSKICSYADILIPGRYLLKERDLSLKWRGSKNQQIISKESSDIGECNQIEILIDEFGKITYLGYPELIL